DISPPTGNEVCGLTLWKQFLDHLRVSTRITYVSNATEFQKSIDKLLDVVVETPRGYRNKFVFDLRKHAFRLKNVLPSGLSFPYDFGFVPNTKAADGDPVDVLILMDESAFPGCIVTTRLIGVLEAKQTEQGKSIRNDRLIAVAEPAHDYGNLRTIKDLNLN